jgi:hypothetical protein
MNDFPHANLTIMALLDTLHYSGLTISASGVTPTMTVILLHSSTPFIVLGSRYLFPNRKYSSIQMKGVALISAAVIISASRPIVWIYDEIDRYTAVSSLVYVSAAAVQSLGNLYKEKSLIEWSKPVDIHLLSSWLFLYQLAAVLLFGPVIYFAQGKATS